MLILLAAGSTHTDNPYSLYKAKWLFSGYATSIANNAYNTYIRYPHTEDVTSDVSLPSDFLFSSDIFVSH